MNISTLHRTARTVPLLLALACTAAPDERTPVAAPPPDGTPRLLLFLVIDQARADYFVRFRPLFEHGLDRLLRESVVFTDARYDNAWTLTAPGHATLATGLHPSRHGIIANHWFDRELGEEVDSDEDDRYDEDRSPARLLAPTLADWMKERWPESKVLGAGGKSRGAIWPAGHRADGAFWLDWETGRFLTSDYYAPEPPDWLAEFHRDPLPDRFFGSLWEPLPGVAERAAELGLEPLERGLGHHQFPHPIGGASVAPDESYYSDFRYSPFADRYLIELATALIVGEELGADAYPDFLGLSFSALDMVGHGYGPDSPEVLDTLLRLDRALGDLLDFVDERFGLDRTLVSLSSDHGVAPVPEVRLAHGDEALRFGAAETSCLQGIAGQLDERYELPVDEDSDSSGAARWFVADLYLDPGAAGAAGLTAAELEREVATLAEACPGVAHAWTRTELTAAPSEDDDPLLVLHRHDFHPERSPDVLLQLEPWAIASSSSTTHGSPYEYDSRVPWLLRLPGGHPARIDRPVRTVDVAPTLAALLGLEPPEGLDGESLARLLDRP